MWIIDPDATSLEDIATRTALCQRYLSPCVTTLNHYKARLRGTSFPILKEVSILLAIGKEEGEVGNELGRRMHRSRHLSNMMALRTNDNAVNVCLKRKL